MILFSEKRQKLIEIYKLMLNFEFSTDDLIPLVTCSSKISKNCEKWVLMLTSDWFAILLFSFLRLDDIARLDSSICLNMHRMKWLECLSYHSIPLELDGESPVTKKYFNWVISKNIKINELDLAFECEASFKLSNINLSELLKNNPNIKKVALSAECFRNSLGSRCFEYLAKFCRQIELIYISCDEIPLYTISKLGASCNQLKSVTIDLGNKYTMPTNNGSQIELSEIEILLKNNKNLMECSLRCNELSGEVLVMLGKYCPDIRVLDLTLTETVTKEQIESFTKGCQKLTHLLIFYENYAQANVNVLLKCLGNNTHFLVELYLYGSKFAPAVEAITYESFECLLQGCPLTAINFTQFHISTTSLIYLSKYGTEIHNLELDNCGITDEGMSWIRKFPKLKKLSLNDNHHISDAGIDILVKDNFQLERLGISHCDKLTNNSLLNIAKNCSHLKFIECQHNHFKKQLYYILYAKCKSLTHIDDESVPNKLSVALHKRARKLRTKNLLTFEDFE